MPNEPIPGELRFKWMTEMFPDCTVVWEKRVLPQEPSGPDDTAFWDAWKQASRGAMQSAFGDYWNYPDVVFASEEYGHKLADTLGATFVPVDIARAARPISGTAIRNDPFGNWEFIPNAVKPHFVKRVTLFGPESTGKSTLATALGQHYNTIVIPEYGSTYTEAFGSEVNENDIQKIVQGHLASVAAGKRQANKILIEDTDPVMSGVWSDMLVGKRDAWFDTFGDYGDLYLLTDIDIPWVDDGTRYFKNDEDRKRFFDICENELIRRGINYVKVSGSHEERLATAISRIDEIC